MRQAGYRGDVRVPHGALLESGPSAEGLGDADGAGAVRMPRTAPKPREKRVWVIARMSGAAATAQSWFSKSRLINTMGIGSDGRAFARRDS